MKRPILVMGLLLVLMTAGRETMVRGEGAKGAETLYSDSTGTSSATVSQALPGHQATTQMLLTNVTRISITQETFVIEWGGTSVTILPRQFVSAITLNKRVAGGAAATQAGTQPGH